MTYNALATVQNNLFVVDRHFNSTSLMTATISTHCEYIHSQTSNPIAYIVKLKSIIIGMDPDIATMVLRSSATTPNDKLSVNVFTWLHCGMWLLLNKTNVPWCQTQLSSQAEHMLHSGHLTAVFSNSQYAMVIRHYEY